ncbi:2-polyprenyl-6-methoxyphenol hydroxylase [Labedella phragmitis]|uniref:2-polyprenyl-6-methoxyphenol hydroxylase n=1 Tax=Labedella phragmitis TaxID=2498849 RepID=A0A444PSI8_9MICO|nr:FAD-dependent monooxygenase [Labedella phragmitis]RWZ50826.1 2-polyprenyl-6-methoxyphenol hydroxylase [Labedella phragmitis]
MAIRVACVGGGPGGLFFSTLLKRARPDIEVVLIERNRPTDAFGFGVVFSDRTLQRIDDADPVLHDALARYGVHWDAIAVALKGETHTFAGNGMAAVHRRVLLRELQGSAADAGVDLRFGTEVRSLDELSDFDVVVGADGANSRIRDMFEPELGSTVETAVAKFIWFGTTHLFDGLTFLHRKNEHGNFAAHAYPISDELSTFIVETDERTWRAAGLDAFDMSTPPGASDDVTRRYLERLFADDIHGAELVGNNSRWGNFRTRRTEKWHSGNVVLLGDAVHTAHFSVGSGTKMAMEDAIVLARELAAPEVDVRAAFERFEEERRPEVERIQNAAGPSLSWWENFGRYYDALDPLEFAFHFFSRSIDIERVRRRDPHLAEAVDDAWRREHGAPPLESPLDLGAVRVTDRRLRLVDDAPARLSDAADTTLEEGVQLEALEAPVDERAAAEVSPSTAAPVVLVHGGTATTRTLVAERARLEAGRVVVILDDDLDDAAAATLILSGRADAVAKRERSHATA